MSSSSGFSLFLPIVNLAGDEISDGYLPLDGSPDGSTKILLFAGDPKQERRDIVVSSGDGILVWSDIPLFTVSSVALSYSGGETSFKTTP